MKRVGSPDSEANKDGLKREIVHTARLRTGHLGREQYKMGVTDWEGSSIDFAADQVARRTIFPSDTWTHLFKSINQLTAQ
uniref:Uncharacterized protein n=1 Tax=Solanum lycopersicum TaxID=4081 RepID=A0A3Q7F531_SOLLC